jgi:outer membrane protein assembly factor BamB
VGPGSSPILYGDTLVLTRDGCDQQYITALEKDTGRSVWKIDRPPHDTPVMVYRKAFTTPLVFENDGTEQMVVVGAQWIVSYNPATGEERWRVDTGPTFSNASCPAYGDGMVYACTAYGGTRMFAIRTDGRGDVTDTHVAWELQRSTPRRTSPLLVGHRLYLVSERGVASCVDARTGEVYWSQRLDGAYSASPIYAGGRVYFFGENGTTTVAQPGDSFRSLAENHIDGRIMATPAFVNRSIILRTDAHLYRIEQRSVRRDG